MPQSPPEKEIPLIVDLDGTLLKTDLLWEFLARLLRRNPFSIFQILFWWTRGRACLKKQLAARIKIDPATLPYNEKFLDWLREQKSAGRKIILATASDLQMAKPVADYVSIFDEILASDGKTNLRSQNKLKLLVEKFGLHQFDYAGNSSADLSVWRGAREAIVVNASRTILKRARYYATVNATFAEGYAPFFIARRFCGELFWRSGYLISVLAGLLLAAAFPKINIAGFAWIAPALFIFAARNKSGGDAFRVGYIGGITFWLATLYWLLLMPAPGFSILGWVALCAFLALFPAIWLWLVNVQRSAFSVQRSWSARLIWSLSGAAIWVALEMIRARIFGGFPWNFIGDSQFQMLPLIQIASVTGVYGISFLVVWTSLSFFFAAEMIFQKPANRFGHGQAEIILPFLAVIAVFVFGEMKLQQPTQSTSTLRVTLIQPSIPQTLIWDQSQNAIRFQQLLQLSETALTNKTDLLVWPESAVPELTESNYIAIAGFVRAHHVWLIFNADDVEPRPNAKDEYDNDVFNAAFFFDPNGDWISTYHKQALVIFGEYIPLERWLPFIKYLTPITGSFAAGNEPVQFQIGNVNTSPLICFEDTFPQLARKATKEDTQFLVNLTNDGWFGDSAEQWQHMAIALFRAVENGVPLVRCCNNGITCWIDANGRVREIFHDQNGSVYGAGAMTIDLPVQDGDRLQRPQTFYNRHGDWFGWSCVGISLLIFVRKIVAGRKKTI
jgi:apolipoprotein N-acyltransferase